MDILEETDVFLSACQLTQDESNNLVFNGITGCFESKYLADWFVNQINFGWKLWRQAQAVPEGFVLIKDDTKTVVAIERMVEQQVEASGMDSRRLERLDGWKIIEAAVKAQEPAND